MPTRQERSRESDEVNPAAVRRYNLGMGPVGVTLYLDEYNPDLAIERDVFVMGGVVVRSGVHRDRAATAFGSLAADDPRFAGKARKWEAAQFDTFATYLLGQEILPVATWVALDVPLLAALRRRSGRCQGSCRLKVAHALRAARSPPSAGLSVTWPAGAQLRTPLAQRSGRLRRARA